MISWRTRRQLFFLLILFTLVFTPISIYFLSNAPEPSCFDNKKNQGEINVDCGGPCSAVCKEEVSKIKVLWSRAFMIREGEYDLAALVENPNNDFGAKSFTYKFEVYDKDNDIILEKTGTGFANPREQFIIFEPKIFFGDKTPFKVFLEISDVNWERKKGYVKQQLKVKDELLELAPTPRLSATIINDLPTDVPNVEAVATILSEEDNVIAVSASQIGDIKKGESQRVFFTWPTPFPEPPRICIRHVEAVLLFDKSGSMNDDNENPPQPLTDAKNAAKVFVNELSSRDKIGLITFATNASFPIDQPLTKNFQKVREAISKIKIPPEEETGSTNLGDAIDKGIDELEINGSNTARKALIILTDGRANAPINIEEGEKYAKEKAFEAKTKGYEIYSIGLGDSVNQYFLENEISSSPQKYYFAKTSSELDKVYKDIAQDVCPEKTYLTRIFVRSLDESF